MLKRTTVFERAVV
jgi:hypothetical protein